MVLKTDILHLPGEIPFTLEILMRQCIDLSECISLTCYHRLLDVIEATSEAEILSRKSAFGKLSKNELSHHPESQIRAATEKSIHNLN